MQSFDKMMRPRNILTLIAAFLSFAVYAQEFNKMDEQGRKQGPFKKYFESEKDKIFYEGQFRDDKPFGRFTYYHKNGSIKSYMDYSENGKVARSKVFMDDGSPLASGNYIERKKDSTWVYFNNNDGIIGIENWIKGEKNGIEVVFFNSSDTSEVIHWNGNKMNGPWRQYFGNGNLKLRSTMLNDAYDGVTEYFHDNGKLNIKGKYVNSKRSGSWYHYNSDGSLQMQVLYRGGKVVKEKRENGIFTEYFEPNMPESEITYKNGKKNGPFTIFHDTAKRVKVEERDQLTGESISKENIVGVQPKMIGEYRNDRLHGIITHYNSVGVLIKKENFENGILVNK